MPRPPNPSPRTRNGLKNEVARKLSQPVVPANRRTDPATSKRLRNQVKRRSPLPPSFHILDLVDVTLTSPDRSHLHPVSKRRVPMPVPDLSLPPADGPAQMPVPGLPPIVPDAIPGSVPPRDEIIAALEESGLVVRGPSAAEYVQEDLAAAHLQGEYIVGLCENPGVRKALSVASDPRLPRFLAALSKLEARGTNPPGIAALARKHGIGPLELTEIWRDHCVRETVLNLAVRAPEVAEHVAEDALSTRLACSRCDGSGDISVIRLGEAQLVPCPQCDGAGWTRKSGDPHARDLMMKSIGVLKQGPGIVVSIDQRQVRGESVIEQLERAERETGTGGGNTVDVD